MVTCQGSFTNDLQEQQGIYRLVMSENWKNASVLLVHKKGDAKELKNYQTISLLSVVYKSFTQVLVDLISDTLHLNSWENRLYLGLASQQ